MKPSTRLSSAVFQLTPTRTRCDLIIIANDKKEKIASGLLNPFLSHLKTAQAQIAKGGYSILLKPETDIDAAWFTKATLERFVRFVSTPEVLERVYTIETEILQIEEAIAMQSSNDIEQSIVEDDQGKPLGCCEGSKSVPNANEQAIVLYEPGAPPPEANGSCLHEGNSKIQLLKVLETRKTMLQKEQGMAFARAAAAGFDIDDMAPLVSFAECFGAVRLMEACSKFIELWKSKHETGEWLDIEASEALRTRSGLSAMNPSGIILSTPHNKDDDSNHELASEDKGKSGSTYNTDNPAPNGQQEYFQRQFPPIVFPPWPMHAQPGIQPVFQPYTVQGMPYYQAYTGHAPFFQPPQHPMEHSPSNFGDQTGRKAQFPDGRDGNTGSEMLEIDRTRSLDDMDAEISYSRKPRKKSGSSNKKQSGMVVIRNINYVTSKEKKSRSESNSDSDSDSDTQNENYEDDSRDAIHQNDKRSSKSKGNHLKSENKLNFSNDEVSSIANDTDGHWQAFQNCLLRGSDEDAHAGNEGMFAMEKDVKIKRRANTVSVDPLALGARDTGEIQDSRLSDIHRISGSSSCRPRGSGDDALFSSMGNDFRKTNDLTDIQFAETNGRKILPRTMHEDFMIDSQQEQSLFRNSSDPLAMNSFEGVTNKLNKDASPGIADETFIVPFRSMSIDQVGQADRFDIDIESEIPSLHQRLDSEGSRNRIHYEPDDLSLMPERGAERKSAGYDPALDYEMQVCAEGSQEKGGKDVPDMKEGLRKPGKDRRSKVTSEVLYKQRTGGPLIKSKMTPSADARARAESLRSYKADLQKMKKEKEEAEAKRLEALKLERQKRIVARGNSTSGKPSVLSPQTKQFPAKLSPGTNRGSKFSDSEPGPSSPLQRSKIRTSLGPSELLKTSKTSKLSEGSHMAGNRLIRSTSSLSDTKKENDVVTPDSKTPMARVRRLSEPKAVNNPPVTSMKVRSAEAVLKRKLYEGPERNKISAIINLDRSKAATLPELKIKTSKPHVNEGANRSAVKDQKVNEIKPSTLCETAELNVSNCEKAHQIDADDNTIVEKTVVMLECGKPCRSALHSSEGELEGWNQGYDDHGKKEKSYVISELDPIHAPPSPMDDVHRDPVNSQHQSQLDSSEVKRAYSEDPPKFTNTKTAEKPDPDHYACVSSVDHPCASQLEYGKAPLASSELASRVEQTVKAQVPDVKNVKMDKTPAASQKTLVKESSKGLRRLLKFGKKNHTSSAVDKSFDSDCTSVDGTELDDNGRKTASRSEVRTLKNLISHDETSSASNAPRKTSRHFSLFSPFRIKTSEKKQAS
ncbi:hypothetical protein BUALT_Bualt14G0117400 [Buddleja alternifolia]|uniref:COP1-interacting protein 7 n=1 Tax=Buddleja alternifolia TaxID=168488 RepID=A0AAV6WS95_9LAMI|nr:hypothetical protein BUALT_Bualt14G0117400 [Buddleja alternifolia]